LDSINPPTPRAHNTIAAIVQDVLVRIDLPIDNLRGQTYDGAANMAGVYNGCQAIIAQKQPLALHFHCSGHCSNLVAQAASKSSPVIMEALECTHEVGVLVSRSGKCRSILSSIAAELTANFSSDLNQTFVPNEVVMSKNRSAAYPQPV